MVRHVPAVAALQIAQGVLECGGSVLFALIPSDAPGASRATEIFLFVGLPLAVLAGGVLRIVAGAVSLSYRGRILGILALVTGGLASTITCFCCPTSLALLGYGLTVYLNDDVRLAFDMRARGISLDTIRTTF